MFCTNTADGSRTLYSPGYQETFRSERGALSEARHVFLEASGVAERLRKGQPSQVLEVGFGSGLNFLLSADLATGTGTALEYLALERTLLPDAVVAGLEYARHLQHPELLAAYLTFRSDLPEQVSAGRYRVALNPLATLDLLVGEAQSQALPEGWANAVYQDAFSPDANPELWSEAFLAKLCLALEPGGFLSTYSVKSLVRRRLAGLGLEVEKRPGPPLGKREMLLARKPA